MFAVSNLAWSEFKVGFSRRKTGAPGARDFVSLAAFFGLMTFLFLLGWSVRDGLWARIEQVLLGALPDGRPPIRLGYHIDNTSKINGNVLDAFEKTFPSLAIVPERSGDGEKGAVILPGLSVVLDPAGSIVEIKGPWGQGRKDKRTLPFRIQAIPLASPLWSWIIARAGAPASKSSPGVPAPAIAATAEHPPLDPSAAPLMVAASRHLFDQHFRYDLYRSSIMANRLVPCDLKQRLPEKLDRPDDLKTLILEVKENVVGPGGKRSTVPGYYAFDVVWVDSFPIASPTALVFPLSTYEVLLLSAENQLADIRPDLATDGSKERITQARLSDIDLEKKGTSEFLAFAQCVGAVGSEDDTKANICGPESAPPGERPLPAETTGTCESLRDRSPIKYPRLVNNGQDLLICTGEHRRLRVPEVASCAKSAGVDDLKAAAPDFAQRFTMSSAPAGMAVAWLGPSSLSVPCEVLSEKDIELAKALAEDRRTAAVAAGAAGEADPAWLAQCVAWKGSNAPDATGGPPAVASLIGYQDVTVYASTPTPSGADGALQPKTKPLNEVIKDLLAWETMLGRPAGSAPVPVFSLNQEYESALVRFGVLSLIIEKVSTPLALGALALYLSLTMVILSTAIAHRRRQYGLLLMSGLNPGHIGYIVALQIIFSCFAGGVAGVLLFEATLVVVNTLLAQSAIVNNARLLIGLDVPTFLSPITGEVIGMLWSVMVLLAISIGIIMVRLQGITTARAPIELVKS